MAASKLTPYKALSSDTEKLCTTASVMVDSRKKPKHHHTTGSFRNARSCSAFWSGCRTATTVLSLSRCSTSSSKIAAYMAAAARYAVRQLVRLLMPTRNSGATAQPRLPVRPCALNAYPRRPGETRWFMIVKSTG